MRRIGLIVTAALVLAACGTTPVSETGPAPLPTLEVFEAQRLAALESWIEHPDGVVDYGVLAEIARLRRDPGGMPSGGGPSGFGPILLPDEIEDLGGRLAAALPRKRGEARAVAIFTLTQLNVPAAGLPDAFVATWPEMSPEQRGLLLHYSWPAVRSPALVPFLRAAATSQERPTQWHVEDLPSLALARLSDFDAEGARAMILEDLLRSHPRFAGIALLSLPDDAIPAVDAHFAPPVDEIRRGCDLWKIPRVVERYGTPAALPRAEELLRHRRWACAVQSSLVRFIIKHDRERGLALVAEATSWSGERETGCYRSVLSDVLPSAWGADAEKLAISFLTHADGELRRDAAHALGRAGSPAAMDHLLHLLTENPDRAGADWQSMYSVLNQRAYAHGPLALNDTQRRRFEGLTSSR